MQTQSACYKETSKMTIKGVLWHSTGADNPALKRYVQPSDKKPSADTYTKEKWLEVLGTNPNKNDWNHIYVEAGLNYWIGELADGTVAAVQTMPDNYRPWGCASGNKGSCNDGWIQFEICEDGLTDKNYFNAVYKEACELTAYLCKTHNLNPTGTTTHKGVTVPVILCHADSYSLGLGSNHGDVLHWFKKHGKTMADVRKDVAALIGTTPAPEVKSYKIVTTVNRYASASDAKAKKNSKGTYSTGTYYIYNKYPTGIDGMYNISTDKTGNSAGSWINPEENIVKQVVIEAKKAYELDYAVKTLIVDKSVKRSNTDCVKAIKKILSNNKSFDPSIAKEFFSVALKYNIDPLMAISQSILETGWFKYEGSAVTADHHNYCGLGVTELGKPGNVFTSIKEGVTAQLQHLFAYGCTDSLPEELVDTRFKYVTRGIAPYWQQLAGRWACPGYPTSYKTAEEAMAAEQTYGQKILTLCKQITATSVTSDDIEKYFPSNTDIDPLPSVDPEVVTPDPEVDPIPVDPEPPVEPEDVNLKTIILNCIKMLVEFILSLLSK